MSAINLLKNVSQALSPFKNWIGWLASYMTILQFFSGFFICKDIFKKGNCNGISSTPFVGGIIVGLSMLKYSIMLKDEDMLRVNIFAVILNGVYSFFYICYSNSKWEEILSSFILGIPVIGILWGYAAWEDESVIKERYGLIVTLMMLGLLGAPLMNVKEIIAHKDASSIPFSLTLMGTIVTFLWLLYAIILENYFMIIQNFVGFWLCIVQLILIFMYPRKTRGGKTKLKLKNK